MIILEGPDGAGKTTLLEQIVQNFRVHVGERGTDNRDLLYTVTVSDTFKALKRAVTGSTNMCVWDRLFFSEFVYPKYMGRSCQFNDGQRLHVLEVMRALKCPIIWCLPPREAVIDNARKDHQMEGVDGNVGDIWDDYERMYLWTPPQTIVYDYTRDKPGRVFEVIKSYEAERKHREW